MTNTFWITSPFPKILSGSYSESPISRNTATLQIIRIITFESFSYNIKVWKSYKSTSHCIKTQLFFKSNLQHVGCRKAPFCRPIDPHDESISVKRHSAGVYLSLGHHLPTHWSRFLPKIASRNCFSIPKNPSSVYLVDSQLHFSNYVPSSVLLLLWIGQEIYILAPLLTARAHPRPPIFIC